MTKIAIGYYRALESALAYRHARKIELTQRFADAAVLGDDRENSPLDDAKLMLEVNEGKTASLTAVLANYEPVDDIALGKAQLGSWLKLTLQDGRELSVVLINTEISLDADHLPEGVRHLSCETELGRSMLAEGKSSQVKAIQLVKF